MSEREYPVPGFPDYFVLADGQVVSYKLGKRSIIKGARQVYGFQGKRVEYRHRLISSEGERYARQGQVVIAAKYGRWPEPYEEVRHMDGDHTNNSMSNLQLGDHLNNIIDDIERGDRQTSVEQLDLAIARLMSIREKLE